MKARPVVWVLLVAISIFNTNAQFARLVMRGEPGDWIVGDTSVDITYTPQNSTFFFATVREILPSGEPSELLFSLGLPDLPYASLSFGTEQLGIPIQIGVYSNARRAGFEAPGHPGLDVSFGHRGCNSLTGNFSITDLSFGPASEVLTFAATFEQHCEGVEAALFGSLTYTAVPEPSTVSLLACAAGVVLFCARRRLRR